MFARTFISLVIKICQRENVSSNISTTSIIYTRIRQNMWIFGYLTSCSFFKLSNISKSWRFVFIESAQLFSLFFMFRVQRIHKLTERKCKKQFCNFLSENRILQNVFPVKTLNGTEKSCRVACHFDFFREIWLADGRFLMLFRRITNLISKISRK